MYQTKITELLGTKYPIIGGTMMDLSRADYVAAIADAGALGVIASAIYRDEEDFRGDLRKVKEKTDQPFGVNINLFPMMDKLDNKRYVEIMLEEGVKIVETSGFAPPEDLVKIFKENGMIWMHKCVGVRYAKKAASMGADAVTLVGYENGGATGNLNQTTLVLIPEAVDELDIPVIAGGGIVDGRGILAAFALGASGVILGTRLLLSEEAPIHPNLKEALLKADGLSTDVIMRSVGFAHRIWMNEPAKMIQKLENEGAGLDKIYPYASGKAARKMFETGDLTAGTVSCSQAIGLIHSIMPVRDIIQQVMQEATDWHKKLQGIFQ